MDIKVGDRVRNPGEARNKGVVIAVLNADVPYPVVVKWRYHRGECYYSADELEVIS